MDLGDLVCPGNHHVGSGCSKGVRSCRRFLNPDSKELEPHFSIGFLGTEDVAIDDQLQSFIVDLQTLIAIPVTCCCLSDSPGVRRPQDIHPDQIVNLSGRGNLAMPLVVLHVPVLDLVRLQGRITDSGNIIVSRPVPFSLVKEVWFCIPKDTDRKTFDHIEKVMDGDLEDEMALEYQASPILHDFKKMKTPARMMQLLCDMPSGPHNAEKERLLRELAATIDYHHEDARRLHYLKEAANFMIKRTHPGDLVMDSVGNQVRMRLCPACSLRHASPGALSVGRCSSRDGNSEGKNQ